MRAPQTDNWLILDEVTSTQDVAAQLLAKGESTSLIFAHNQTKGRGRLGRQWVTSPGESLSMSLLFHDYVNHQKPYLIGMAVAIAVAGAIGSELRWPNDTVFGRKKAGGILTELLPRPDGTRVPVVGVGINLTQREFPDEISGFATSLLLEHNEVFDATTLAKAILTRLSKLPEPNEWSDLHPIWDLYDRTAGKLYRLTNGDFATGIGVGTDAQLLCSVNGVARTVMAAEALFGKVSE